MGTCPIGLKMIEIPRQLWGEKFIRVRKRSKKPVDSKWTTDPNVHYNHDDKVLQDWLKQGNNYGIPLSNNLNVIDADSPEVTEVVEKNLPETFTVKTNRGTQSYYRSTIHKKINLKKGGEDVGEILAHGQQAIGPWSIHPKGPVYTVVKDVPIAEIDEARLKAVLFPFIPQEKEPKDRKTYETDPLLEEIKRKLKVTDVLHHYGINTKKNPTMCPLGHDSSRGECFSYTEDVWHCFHCEKSGNIFHLIMEKEGCSFSEAREKAFKLADIESSDSDEVVAYRIHQELVSKLSEERITNDEKKQALTEARIKVARHLIQKRHFKTIISESGKTDMFYVYDEGIYKPDGRRVIGTFAQMALGEFCNNHTHREIQGRILRNCPIRLEDFKESQRRELICIQNGVFNLKTKELMPHSPKYIFLNKLPVFYDPDATCPNIEGFLHDVLEPEDYQAAIELAGYCLWRTYEIALIIFLLGDGGGNGKTQFADLLKKFLGEENVSGITIHQICNDKFVIIKLKTKLLNIHPDIGKRPIEDTAMLMTLTGGRDTVEGQRKFGDIEGFINHAKFVFGANNPPRIKDISDAEARRIRCFHFNRKFYSASEYEKHKDNPNAKVEIPHYIEKNVTQEELNGFFLLAVDALEELLERGELANPKTRDETKKDYIEASDNLHLFCLNYVEAGEWEDFIIKDIFMPLYKKWCKDNGIKAGKIANPTAVTKELIEEYEARPSKKRLRYDNIDVQPPVWFGIHWNATAIKDLFGDDPEKPVTGVTGVTTFPFNLCVKSENESCIKDRGFSSSQSSQSAQTKLDPPELDALLDSQPKPKKPFKR